MTNLHQLPEGIRRGNETLVVLTSEASKKVISLLEQEKESTFLRVAIVGGGCNGLSYKLKFVNAPRQGDIFVESGGAPVIVDTKSALYLRGLKSTTLTNWSGRVSLLQPQCESYLQLRRELQPLRLEWTCVLKDAMQGGDFSLSQSSYLTEQLKVIIIPYINGSLPFFTRQTQLSASQQELHT